MPWSKHGIWIVAIQPLLGILTLTATILSYLMEKWPCFYGEITEKVLTMAHGCHTSIPPSVAIYHDSAAPNDVEALVATAQWRTSTSWCFTCLPACSKPHKGVTRESTCEPSSHLWLHVGCACKPSSRLSLVTRWFTSGGNCRPSESDRHVHLYLPKQLVKPQN